MGMVVSEPPCPFGRCAPSAGTELEAGCAVHTLLLAAPRVDEGQFVAFEACLVERGVSGARPRSRGIVGHDHPETSVVIEDLLFGEVDEELVVRLARLPQVAESVELALEHAESARGLRPCAGRLPANRLHDVIGRCLLRRRRDDRRPFSHCGR